MRLVFVLVDALKSTYLKKENMPFLYNLANEKYWIKEIQAGGGFCERSEIITGLDGYDSGNFTAIGLSENANEYASLNLVLPFFEIADKISKRYSRGVLRRLCRQKKITLKPYHIPIDMLNELILTEDGDKKFVNYNTLFDALRKRNKSYSLNGFTSLAEQNVLSIDRYGSYLRDSVNKKIDFIPLYIQDIDTVGHKFGGDIRRIQPHLLRIDKLVEELHSIAIENGYAFIVVGDHGMIPVEKKINIIQLMSSKTNKKLDYKMFLDSTIVRFWFGNEYTEKYINDFLRNELSLPGILIDRSNSYKYRIPLDVHANTERPIYGDLVWCANPGVLISPDYFHDSKACINGMHGYLHTVKGDGTGLLVKDDGINKSSKDCAFLYEVCDELCYTLEIDKPNGQDWKRVKCNG